MRGDEAENFSAYQKVLAKFFFLASFFVNLMKSFKYYHNSKVFLDGVCPSTNRLKLWPTKNWRLFLKISHNSFIFKLCQNFVFKAKCPQAKVSISQKQKCKMISQKKLQFGFFKIVPCVKRDSIEKPHLVMLWVIFCLGWLVL